MGLGLILCKIGLHSGDPEVSNDNSEFNEDNPTIEEGQKRKVTCARCGLVYTELVNTVNWYHPM